MIYDAVQKCDATALYISGYTLRRGRSAAHSSLRPTYIIFGLVEKGTLFDRSDPSLLLPINLEKPNLGLLLDLKKDLQVGSYGQDGSLLYIDRQGLNVHGEF